MRLLLVLPFFLTEIFTTPLAWGATPLSNAARRSQIIDPEITPAEYQAAGLTRDQLLAENEIYERPAENTGKNTAEWHEIAQDLLLRTETTIQDNNAEHFTNNLVYGGIEVIIKNIRNGERRKIAFDISFTLPDVVPSFLLSGGWKVKSCYELDNRFTVYEPDMLHNLSEINQYIFAGYKPGWPFQKFGFEDTEDVLIDRLVTNNFSLHDASWQNLSFSLSADERINFITLNLASIIDLCPWCFRRLQFLMNPQTCQNWQDKGTCAEISRKIFRNILKKCGIIREERYIEPTLDYLWNRNNLQVCVSAKKTSIIPKKM